MFIIYSTRIPEQLNWLSLLCSLSFNINHFLIETSDLIANNINYDYYTRTSVTLTNVNTIFVQNLNQTQIHQCV